MYNMGINSSAVDGLDAATTQDDAGSEQDETEEEEEVTLEESTAAEIVHAGVTQGRIELDSMPIDHRELDEAEEHLIQRFTQSGCHCVLGSNQNPCCSTITADHYRSVHCQMLELTHDELDLVVMGQVMAGCFSAETSAHRGQERGKTYTIFDHNGTRICKKTFLFLHCMSDMRFKSIKTSYLANGVVPRVHGNMGKSRKVGLSLKEIQDIVQFIMNYAGVCRERGEREGRGGEREEGGRERELEQGKGTESVS